MPSFRTRATQTMSLGFRNWPHDALFPLLSVSSSSKGSAFHDDLHVQDFRAHFRAIPHQHVRGARQGGRALRGEEDRAGNAPQHAALSDMFPLVRQLRAVTDHAISATARLAGAELITFPNNEASFPEVKDRIAKTIDFVKSFKPEQIDGTEDKEIVVKFSSGERKFKGQTFLLNFCLPNFYFHATTAYDILRHCGIELGKRDFMGTPVTL
jgi:hypothetical protein